MQLMIGLSILSSTVSFVLAILAIVSGKSPGLMEEYHIILFNTSSLGHNLIPTATRGGNTPTTVPGGGGVGGLFNSLVAGATSVVGAVESELAHIQDDIADELAGTLGIKQFYSLHVMNVCEGDFTPNATTTGPGYNVTNCTQPMQTSYMNISALLDHELRIGPLDLNLADIKFADNLQQKLDQIPKLFLAMAILYILGAGFLGLSMLGSGFSGLLMLRSIARHFSQADDRILFNRRIILSNFVFALLAALFLLVGNLITTVGGQRIVDGVTNFGEDIGLVATRGAKFIAITWAAFALITSNAIYWGHKCLPKVFASRGADGWTQLK